MADTGLQVVGTKQEVSTFHEVDHHFRLADQDLTQRRREFKKQDEMYRSHIDKNGWPYNSVVYDPRVSTALNEKTARLFAKKLRGRMIPREGGDSLGARINNELLSFQWDDNERVDNKSMLSKWATMDQNARKYGASFALVPWRWERIKTKISKSDKSTNVINPPTDVPKKDKKEDSPTYKSVPFYDGPDFKPLINRDCLPNPSYSTIKNWFQYRDYVTLQELENVNDAARGKPVYKNLDLLKTQLHSDKFGRGSGERGGDRRDRNYTSRNKSLKGLRDFMGSDEVFKVVEIITEYRQDRWITFAPRHGVILRDIENPYDHGQIPIVLLKYYPVDDDLYGLSEMEPVEKLQKAANSLINQYLDSINMSLYAPLKVKATGVQMHTLEFGPGKKWIMDDPNNVVAHDQAPTGISEFSSTYSFVISAINSALGESSQGIGGIDPFNPQKTATEVNDSSTQRLARDNFNQIFLAESLKKQMNLWHLMDRQFMFSDPRSQQRVIRITGKDSIRYFQKRGLDRNEVPEGAEDLIATAAEEGVTVRPEDVSVPSFPVESDGAQIPKFNVEDGDEMGSLILTPEDMGGTYDYIPDVESMQLPDRNQAAAIKRQTLELALNPQAKQAFAEEGFRVKAKELMEDLLEDLGITDGDKYFEKIQEGIQNEQTIQGGGDPTQAGVPGSGNGQQSGVAGGSQAVPGGQDQQLLA